MKRSFITITMFAAAAIFLATGYDNVIQNANSKTAVTKEEASTGKVQIGGSFALTNQRGENVTDQDFKGKLMLVFFGFTNCPDVCPTDLMIISKVMQALGDDGEKVAPIFITVDSQTDTVERMADYLVSFHPSIQGLTGTEEQLKQAQEAYKIYAKKIEMESMMGNMFNHSAYTYLMNREGKYLTHFAHDSKPEKILEEIKKYL
jgi:protein SCO1/2